MLKDNEPLVLSIDNEGKLYLNVGGNEEEAIDETTVITRTAAVIRRNSGTPVLVKADRVVPYGRVVTAMVLLQQAGADKVGFITDPLDSLREP